MNDKYCIVFADLPARDIIVVLSTSKGYELSLRISFSKPSHRVSQESSFQQVPWLEVA